MAKLMDSASIIEIVPYSAHKDSDWVKCVVAVEINTQVNDVRFEFSPDRDGGILHLRECEELIQKSREYIRRVTDYEDTREDLSFFFFPTEGYFTMEMEYFDLPSDDELNHNSVILTFSMSLMVFDSKSQTSMQVSASYPTDEVLTFIAQFERELYELIAAVND